MQWGVRKVNDMQVGKPSTTAMATAQARAYHQLADEPRIFTDPLAVRIVGADTARDTPFDRGLDPEFVRRRRLFLAARSRFAEDTVAKEIAAGTRQVVILGAGMDTSAYRNPHPDVRFFEVDHPDTQAWKRNRLAETGITVPATMSFVPVDFARDRLAESLTRAGLDPDAGAVFVWLGVVAYLDRDAITGTLRYMADRAGGSIVVFDYSNPPAQEEREAQRARAKRVAAVGEPWVSFFTADQMYTELTSAGFTAVDDRAAAHLVRTYVRTPAGATVTAVSGPHLVRARTAPASATHHF